MRWRASARKTEDVCVRDRRRTTFLRSPSCARRGMLWAQNFARRHDGDLVAHCARRTRAYMTLRESAAVHDGGDVRGDGRLRCVGGRSRSVSIAPGGKFQRILREESHFDKVSDPGGGSYYIEALTDSIAAEAWKVYKIWRHDLERRNRASDAALSRNVKQKAQAHRKRRVWWA